MISIDTDLLEELKYPPYKIKVSEIIGADKCNELILKSKSIKITVDNYIVFGEQFKNGYIIVYVVKEYFK